MLQLKEHIRGLTAYYTTLQERLLVDALVDIPLLNRIREEANRPPKKKSGEAIKYYGQVSKTSSEVYQDVLKKTQEAEQKEQERIATETRLAPLRTLLEQLNMMPPACPFSKATKEVLYKFALANKDLLV